MPRFSWLSKSYQNVYDLVPHSVRQWIGKPELSVIVVLLILVCILWLFVDLADDVMDGDTQDFDSRVVHALRSPVNRNLPRGPEWLVDAGRDITALGGIAVLSMMTIAAAGYLALQRKTHAMWLMLLAVVSGVVVSTTLKFAFGRERPETAAGMIKVFTSSFPSGHSMLSAIVYLVLGAMLARMEPRWTIKLYFIALAVILTVLVGVSRVYLGVHYPTDVLAGWMAGLAWAGLWWLIARFLQRKGAVEPTIEKRPA